jgi:hypothetical protein
MTETRHSCNVAHSLFSPFYIHDKLLAACIQYREFSVYLHILNNENLHGRILFLFTGGWNSIKNPPDLGVHILS